jgi:integrase
MTEFQLLPDESRNDDPGHPPKLLGQKPPLKPREVWAIRVRLQIKGKSRDLALFNLAIDSKLRSCDLVALRVSDVASGDSIKERTTIVQQKTGRPVQFEMTEQTREAVQAWIRLRGLHQADFLFPSRIRACPHLTTRQ